MGYWPGGGSPAPLRPRLFRRDMRCRYGASKMVFCAQLVWGIVNRHFRSCWTIWAFTTMPPVLLAWSVAFLARIDDAERARAAGLRQAWRAGRVSKYNHAREVPPPVAGPFVLVVDQTFGDASIAYGLADEGSFVRMLEAALDEHPELPVLLKVHPDVIAGRKRGHFERLSNGSAARVTAGGD